MSWKKLASNTLWGLAIVWFNLVLLYVLLNLAKNYGGPISKYAQTAADLSQGDYFGL